MDLVLHGHKIKLIVFRYTSTKNEIHFFHYLLEKSDSFVCMFKHYAFNLVIMQSLAPTRPHPSQG